MIHTDWTVLYTVRVVLHLFHRGTLTTEHVRRAMKTS